MEGVALEESGLIHEAGIFIVIRVSSEWVSIDCVSQLVKEGIVIVEKSSMLLLAATDGSAELIV